MEPKLGNRCSGASAACTRSAAARAAADAAGDAAASAVAVDAPVSCGCGDCNPEGSGDGKGSESPGRHWPPARPGAPAATLAAAAGFRSPGRRHTRSARPGAAESATIEAAETAPAGAAAPRAEAAAPVATDCACFGACSTISVTARFLSIEVDSSMSFLPASAPLLPLSPLPPPTCAVARQKTRRECTCCVAATVKAGAGAARGQRGMPSPSAGSCSRSSDSAPDTCETATHKTASGAPDRAPPSTPAANPNGSTQLAVHTRAAPLPPPRPAALAPLPWAPDFNCTGAVLSSMGGSSRKCTAGVPPQQPRPADVAPPSPAVVAVAAYSAALLASTLALASSAALAEPPGSRVATTAAPPAPGAATVGSPTPTTAAAEPPTLSAATAASPATAAHAAAAAPHVPYAHTFTHESSPLVTTSTPLASCGGGSCGQCCCCCCCCGSGVGVLEERGCASAAVVCPRRSNGGNSSGPATSAIAATASAGATSAASAAVIVGRVARAHTHRRTLCACQCRCRAKACSLQRLAASGRRRRLCRRDSRRRPRARAWRLRDDADRVDCAGVGIKSVKHCRGLTPNVQHAHTPRRHRRKHAAARAASSAAGAAGTAAVTAAERHRRKHRWLATQQALMQRRLGAVAEAPQQEAALNVPSDSQRRGPALTHKTRTRAHTLKHTRACVHVGKERGCRQLDLCCFRGCESCCESCTGGAWLFVTLLALCILYFSSCGRGRCTCFVVAWAWAMHVLCRRVGAGEARAAIHTHGRSLSDVDDAWGAALALVQRGQGRQSERGRQSVHLGGQGSKGSGAGKGSETGKASEAGKRVTWRPASPGQRKERANFCALLAVRTHTRAGVQIPHTHLAILMARQQVQGALWRKRDASGPAHGRHGWGWVARGGVRATWVGLGGTRRGLGDMGGVRWHEAGFGRLGRHMAGMGLAWGKHGADMGRVGWAGRGAFG
eukprot:353077-Chlamydomonas_euryale.AAC.16